MNDESIMFIQRYEKNNNKKQKEKQQQKAKNQSEIITVHADVFIYKTLSSVQ